MAIVNVASAEGENTPTAPPTGHASARGQPLPYFALIATVSHLVEPADDMLETLDAVPQLAGTRELADHRKLTIRLGMCGTSKGDGSEPRRLKEGELGRVPPVLPAGNVALGTAAAKRCVWGGVMTESVSGRCRWSRGFLSSKPDISLG